MTTLIVACVEVSRSYSVDIMADNDQWIAGRGSGVSVGLLGSPSMHTSHSHTSPSSRGKQ